MGRPAGERNTFVTLENPTTVPGVGDYTESWAPLAPAGFWAAISQATQRTLERLVANTMTAQATHIIEGPYHPQVTTASRAKWTDRAGRVHTASVVGVTDVDQRGIDHVLICVEVAP